MKWVIVLLASLHMHFLVADSAPKNWYDEFIFEDQTFSYEFIRALGYCYSGGADLGECIACARKIEDKNFESWHQHWLAAADKLKHDAETFETKKDFVSAREAFFRASQYYRSASFFLVAKKEHSKSNAAWKNSVECFRKGIVTLPYIEEVKIPYEKTHLPGFLLRSPHANAPILIVNTGFDGTKEELYFEVGKAAYERGYNVLLMEGPGQGAVLREQNLTYRYDWEAVITPTVDFIMGLDKVDTKRIGLLGISLGGYLAARAAAYEHRIAACILNGGVYSMADSVLSQMPAELVTLIHENPKDFNLAIEGEMKNSTASYWFFNNGKWSLGATTPEGVIKALERFNVKDSAALIKCPTLVVDSTDDVFFKGQPKKVYDLLKSPKTFLEFTPKDAAQAHCQMGAIAISNERILHWLNETFVWSP